MEYDAAFNDKLDFESQNDRTGARKIEKTYPKIHFNNRPDDKHRAVSVGGEVRNVKDSNDLNNSNKEAEGEQCSDGNL